MDLQGCKTTKQGLLGSPLAARPWRLTGLAWASFTNFQTVSPRPPVNRPSSDPHNRAIMGGMDDPHARPLREESTNLDLKILDVLREGAQSARLLAETLSQSDEQVGVDADPLWEITEEGRAVVEPHVGVALAPYERGVGHAEVDDERDVAGLVVLLVIALLTAVCAAYSLLTAAGVLGGYGVRTSENPPST